jgi:hypothetical protein
MSSLIITVGYSSECPEVKGLMDGQNWQVASPNSRPPTKEPTTSTLDPELQTLN